VGGDRGGGGVVIVYYNIYVYDIIIMCVQTTFIIIIIHQIALCGVRVTWQTSLYAWACIVKQRETRTTAVADDGDDDDHTNRPSYKHKYPARTHSLICTSFLCQVENNNEKSLLSIGLPPPPPRVRPYAACVCSILERFIRLHVCVLCSIIHTRAAAVCNRGNIII